MSHLSPGLRSRSSSVSSAVSDGTGAGGAQPGHGHTSYLYQGRHGPHRYPAAAAAAASGASPGAGSQQNVRRRGRRSPAPAEKAVLRGDPTAHLPPLSGNGSVNGSMASPGVDPYGSTAAPKEPVAAQRATYSDGTAYNGEWHSGLQHGFGICSFPSGQVYVGEWRRGVSEGQGTMLYSDGDVFDGCWVNGVCDGEGVLFPAQPPGAPPIAGIWRAGNMASRVARDRDGLEEERRTMLINVARAMRGLLPQPSGINVPPPLQQHPSASLSKHRANVAQQQQQQQQQQVSSFDTPGDANEPFPALMVSDSQQFQRLDMDGEPLADTITIPVMPPPGLPEGAAARGLGGGHDTASVLAPHVTSGTSKDDVSTVLFAAAGPSYTTEFSFYRFCRYFWSMMLPFLSLPNLPCPLRTNILDLEREYVVSGAALRVDFEPPGSKVYLALIALVFAIIAGVFGALTEQVINVRTPISITEMVLPFVFCLLFALVVGGYQSHLRVPHALERLDRFQFPVLAKFSSSYVDSRCTTCVATWDDDGENVIYTRKYPRRWALIAIASSILVALCPAIVRGANKDSIVGGPDDFGIVASVSAFLAVVCAMSCVLFQLMKFFDTQRQVLARMRVLSTCAYLAGQSILRPSDHREEYFRLDSPIEFSQMTRGFVGWYFTRCFVLYASTCSNHSARGTSASIITLAMVGMYIAAIIDCAYAWSQDLLVNADYFTTAHLVGLAVMLTAGHMLLAYLYVCNASEKERDKHVYLCDVTSAYHYAKRNMGDAQIVAHCRDIIRDHDVRFKAVAVTITGYVMWLALLLHVVGVGCLTVQVVVWATTHE